MCKDEEESQSGSLCLVVRSTHYRLMELVFLPPECSACDNFSVCALISDGGHSE